MRRKIVILGTGGNCLDILDTVNEINASRSGRTYECVGFLDDNEALRGKRFFDVAVLGPLEAACEYSDCVFVNGIGSPSNFWKKPEIIARTRIPADRFETLIHPSASVSKMSALGRGTVVLQHVTVSSNVTVGDHVIILPNSILSHHDEVGDYTCIAGGVCISGNVKVGRSCYLGTNSAISGHVTLGDRCLVGMGSVVRGDVPGDTVVAGNPARAIRRTVENRPAPRSGHGQMERGP